MKTTYQIKDTCEILKGIVRKNSWKDVKDKITPLGEYD
jgi:hypothetical protein